MAGPTTAPLRLADGPLLWTRLVRAHVEAVISGESPRRLLIAGPAGSGKSRLLRRLRRELTAAGSMTATARSRAEMAAVPREHVLIVDDAHVLDDDQLAAVLERASDPEAALVVTARPWAHSAPFRELADELERSQPAIVLGSIDHADLRTFVEQNGDRLPETCLDSIVRATGGTAWLVSEALAAHDSEGCTGAAMHDGLHRALRDVIAHRLRTVPVEIREFVEFVSLDGDDQPDARRDDLTIAGYADGLLLPTGRPAPIVRAAIHATSPLDHAIGVYEGAMMAGATAEGVALEELLDGVRDPHLAALMLTHGDTVRETDPGRARALYRRARDAGADSAAVAVREAQVEWQLGGIETASRLLDGVAISHGHPDHDIAADTSAAIWAARGLSSMSDAVYRALPPSSSASRARSVIAAFAAGDQELLGENTAPAPAETIPSTLDVSMGLLESGLRATLSTATHAGLGDLIRAAEMYSAARTSAPVPELPAVIAGLAALHLGEPDAALAVLDRALEDDHGGAWAHDRLLLWRAWVALQLERAHEVEGTLETVTPRARSLSPRDRLLFDAVSVSVARRYGDAVALTTAWRGARESLMRASFDLFDILLLGEFVVTAARVGDAERMTTHFARTLAQLERIGSPPAWAPHAHWAGIQQAILRGSPDEMKPHARALVAAAPHSRPAAIMSQAGRVWTSVLSGSVDADAVESAASALGTIGLAWDGARLAGHGAGRTDDRRVSARLLAAARHLHPHEDVRAPATEDDETPSTRPRASSGLSPRELEVAALVVQGKTYTEIGATIFISPRTAEHHIARIRRRLGATNRSDLIAKLRVALEDAASEETETGGTRGRATA